MNFNKAFVLGNLTRDPEVRALPSGQPVASFSIATNRYFTDTQGQKKEETEFHNIVVFGKLADVASRYLTKGALCFVEGKIKTRNWQDQQGQKHWKTEIIAEVLQLGPRGSNLASGAGASGNYSPKSYGSSDKQPAKEQEIPIIEENYTPPTQQEEPSSSDEIDIKDIPF